MSRTRIVKGKIFEKIGGDLKYYSEADITEIASETYAEQSAKDISHSGNPGKPPPSPTLAKCLVKFRPNKSWKGEFGFDWVRIRDSKMAVDFSYNGVTGKYGSTYATQKGAVFTPSATEFNRCVSEYSSFNTFKNKYSVPFLTLLKDQSATLDVITEVAEIPDSLRYEYDTNIFELTILKKLTKSKGTNYDESAVRIKCLQEFGDYKSITIMSSKDKRSEKVGEIKIVPNAKHSAANILFIPVEYRQKRGNVKNNIELDYVNNILRQALIKATTERYPSVFRTGSWFSDFFFTTKDKNGTTVMDMSNMRSIHRYVDDDFMSIKENKKYSNYYRVYCLPESLNLNGVAEDVGHGVKTVVVFQNRDNFTTVVHELLHAMGLYHTFDNDSKFTFKLYNTDNVMDYTHHVGKDRFTTNKFQWKILNKNIT